jgi:hypothetical protein
LGDLSDTFHISVPMLDETYFFKRVYDDNLTHLLEKHIRQLTEQLKRFKLSFQNIANKQTSLIEHDSNEYLNFLT